MTSIIKFTALSGAQNDGPNCYLLQVDEFTFLLDCGWDEWFSDSIIKKIRRHMSQIDAVLLTFPDPQHLGCLPVLVGKLGMNCPIYATVPVYKMGQMFMYDLYQSHHNTEDFDKYTLDDVDMAFERIIQVKHNQTVHLKDKGYGLSIAPIHAAHIIGGTSWKIMKADEEGEIVYAVDFNHKRERHLNGCSLLESLGGASGRSGIAGSSRPPQLLITDAFNATYQQTRRKLRDEQLLTKIIETMRGDGNVLIAVDTAGRVLELAILLDQLWNDSRSGLGAYSLAMLNNVTYNVIEFAKSMIEWMSDKIINSFTDQRNSPFQFKHLKLCHNMGDLAQVSQPKCVLASTLDMESGFSRQLFVRWCSDPRNAVIITGRTSPGTLSNTLINNPNISFLNLEIKKKIPIVGEELDEYERNKKAKKSQNQIKVEQVSSDESEDEEKAEAKGTKHDLLVHSEKSKKGGFFKQAKKTYPMYPFMETRIKWDEYGELIKYHSTISEELFLFIHTSLPYCSPDDFKTQDAVVAEQERLAKENVKVEKPVEEEKEEDTEIPTKCVIEMKKLEVKCGISYIDFEGRSDGESIMKIIQQIKPQEVIVVRGSPQNTGRLVNTIKRTVGTPGSSDAVQVFAPAEDEVVDTTRERHIYQVRLKDSVVNTLRFFKAKDSEVCWLDAKLDFSESLVGAVDVINEQYKANPQQSSSQDEQMEEDHPDGYFGQSTDVENNKENAIPSLVPLLSDENAGHKSYFVNELRLSDFKQVLLKEGMHAEFSGGVLICNNNVAIRRSHQGHVDMEGCLCDDYYKIRDLLYQQYAIL